MLTVGSCFSGIGGIELGLEWTGGFETKWQIEMDDYASKVLEKHWPHVKRYRDIRDVTLDDSAKSLYYSMSQEEREALEAMGKRKDFDEAVRMYDSGLSIQDVAEFYGVSRQSMWQVLQLRGCKFRSNLKFGKENHFHRDTKASDYAQNVLEKAIEKKIVLRKTHCEKCGDHGEMKDGRSKIQAHHPDYNKPLDVMWLCQECHHEWHKTNKAVPRKEVHGEVTRKTRGIDVICGGFP